VLGLPDAQVMAHVDGPAQAQATRQFGRLVGQDVAEHVGGHHHVEPLRGAHQQRRRRVHDHLVQPHVRVALGDGPDLTQEQAVGQLQHVRLVHGGHPAPSAAGQLECGHRHPLGRLRADLADRQRQIAVGHELPAARVHGTVGVEALGVLPHDDQVHRRAQRAQAGARATRPDVGEQLEHRAQLGRRVDAALGPGRVVVVRHRPEQHAVHLRDALEHLVGQGGAVGGQRGEPDGPGLEVQAEAQQLVGGGEHVEGGGGDLGADAVARQDEDLHGCCPPSVVSSAARCGRIRSAISR
jgi:hypothetical protein